MGALYFVLSCLLELIDLNLIKCAWWDQNSDNARILHANEPAKIEMYPYVVSIVLLDPGERFLCAGIHSPVRQATVVITAGSCVNYLIKNRIARENVVVRTNSEYWDCNCGITVQYNVTKWTIHPEYQEHIMPFIGAYSVNDIGMLALDGEWEGYYNFYASGSFQPNFDIKYNNKYTINLAIVGWGYTESSKNVQSELRKLLLNYRYIRKYEACKTRFKMDYLPDNTFCIYPFNGKGPCAYDQGGPLVYTDETAIHLGYGSIVNIYGIISNSVKCGDEAPVIVVNTSNYLDFINNISWATDSAQDKKNRWKFEHYERNEWSSHSRDGLGWFRPGNF